jgi:hypothetical protein
MERHSSGSRKKKGEALVRNWAEEHYEAEKKKYYWISFLSVPLSVTYRRIAKVKKKAVPLQAWTGP